MAWYFQGPNAGKMWICFNDGAVELRWIRAFVADCSCTFACRRLDVASEHDRNTTLLSVEIGRAPCVTAFELSVTAELPLAFFQHTSF